MPLVYWEQQTMLAKGKSTRLKSKCFYLQLFVPGSLKASVAVQSPVGLSAMPK